MIRSVLVVCVGNICRSPAGERALRAGLPGLRVDSAGLGALVGQAADADAAAAAQARGLALDGHVARQFTPDLAAGYDLILVMEPGHRAQITREAPQLSGRTLLFDQWCGGKGIADPYRKAPEFHARMIDDILRAAETWIAKLGKKLDKAPR